MRNRPWQKGPRSLRHHQKPWHIPHHQAEIERGSYGRIKIDIVVFVTGDGDFVPLVRALNKHGIRVVAAYFDFQDARGKICFINELLLKCCNYKVDIGKLDGDREFGATFKSLFRTPSDFRDYGEG